MEQISKNEQILLFCTMIVITLLFTVIEIIFLIIYCKRKTWTHQMTTNTLLSFFSIIHCYLTCIPVFKDNLYCHLSSSLHESTFLSMCFFADYIISYALLSLEKPNLILKHRGFFVNILIGFIIIQFLINTFSIFKQTIHVFR